MRANRKTTDDETHQMKVKELNQAQTPWPEGVKRTRQREGVLAVLEQVKRPMSAAEICSQLEENGEKAWLSTVYRILELFVEKNVALKTTVMNSDTAVYELNRNKHKHYAVCIGCNKMIGMHNCPMLEFIPELDEQNFRVLGHNLEVFGFCEECRTGKS